jgi:hypothetical protein
MNQNNFVNLTNQFEYIEWIIDRTPDYNLTQNTEIIYPTYNINNQSLHNTIQLNHQEDFNHLDDFIPFVSHSVNRISIETEVREINVLEKEKFCCICYETKNSEEISQINCSHKFCGTCIVDLISVNKTNSCCPLCREKICRITFQRQLDEDDFQDLMEIH